MKNHTLRSDERGHPTQLPKEYVDWITQPITRFLKVEAAAGAVLLIATVIALTLANSPWADEFMGLWNVPVGLSVGTFEYSRSMQKWINDALMTLFFFLVALELKREIVLGELKTLRLAMLSISGAIGGMLVPAIIYLVLQKNQPGEYGWGIVMTTDTAFVIACLALLGSKVPHSLRAFMLSLAIIDDIGAITVVAIAYGEIIQVTYVALAIVGLLVTNALSMIGIRSVAVYLLLGSLIWFAFDASGIHPTITGVVLGLMTPTIRWVNKQRLLSIMECVAPKPLLNQSGKAQIDRQALKTAQAAAREALSPLERLEMLLHPWVGFVIMPLFAFANAGVTISFSELSGSLYMAIFAGLVLGKPIGIFVFCSLATHLKLAIRPPDLPWRYVWAGGMLAGTGFTMSLFIANLALSSALVDVGKLAILSASLFSALAGIITLRWLIKRDVMPSTVN
ncbi:Na+/H+ antiporter NhaA [Vibrio sp.]|uniref:Na+/H+ antiporter NhaA n=1 Tax=Vibrio sp. TaxID=678 RepID=UPI003D13BC6C